MVRLGRKIERQEGLVQGLQRRIVYLVGVGTGVREGLTGEAREIIDECDLCVGSRRVLQLLGKNSQCDVFCVCEPEEIAKLLRGHEWMKACVLLSGDVGFYSGAKRLVAVLSDFEVKLIAGVSTLAAFGARLQVAWDEVEYCSLHGRSDNVIGRILQNRYTFALLGGEKDLRKLCDKLIYYRMEEIVLSVGCRLGYPDERIVSGNAGQILEQTFDNLAVVMAKNPHPLCETACPMEDAEFCRDGSVPMTKKELRILSIAKLGLSDHAVLYDIGAGTGSVSIQAARWFTQCRIYAVERRPEAIELLEKNRRMFAADNMKICRGEAPQCMGELEPPTHVFIGGSGGNLREILRAVWDKNSEAIVVVNIVTLETLQEMMQILQEWNLEAEEIVQVAVTKAKKTGDFHLMQSQNPVTVVTVRGGK